MADGIVKWFDDKKGYGFIDSDGESYFVHFREIQKAGFKTLRQDDCVTFIPSKSHKGLLAMQVHLK